MSHGWVGIEIEELQTISFGGCFKDVSKSIGVNDSGYDDQEDCDEHQNRLENVSQSEEKDVSKL